MEFDDNVSAYAVESWMSPFDKKMRVFTIIGSEKSVRVDYIKHDEIEVFNGKIKGDLGNHNDPVVIDGEVEIVKVPKKEPLRAELMDFVSCIGTDKQPLADMYSGKRAVLMVEKCLREGFFRPE
jgi:UDP-2-acetamido-3-amino-2,3-dideoxy-glucuronate N-acetyltransferase